MTWQVAHRDSDKKYRIWSTISDSWITEWETKQGILTFIATSYLQEYKGKVVELYLEFPHNWPAREGGKRMIRDEEGSENYLAWLKTLSQSGDDYYETVEKKYNEVVKELGL
jgi:hypothetical protein